MNSSAWASQTIDEAPFICREYRQSHFTGIFYGKNPLNFSFTLVLFEVILVVVITRIVRFLLKPLKQPKIVSEILGGIIIGPSVLGRNKKFSKLVFPDNASYILKNAGIIGFMYYLFLAGVKMDVSIARKAGKKRLFMALFGFLIPLASGIIVAVSIRKSSLDKQLARPSIIGIVTSVFSITSFPVIQQIIKELNLLSSEVGRLSLSTTIITDVVAITCIVVFEAARQYELERIHGLWFSLSTILVVAFVGGCRLGMLWIVKTTPEGKPVEQAYIVAILLGVLVIGFVTDVTGLNLANGPMWLGLVVPTGPPLGATLVEKAEVIVNEFFMPLSYAVVGLNTDLTSMSENWGSLVPVLGPMLAAYVAKFVAILVVSRLYEMPIRESLALCFVMSMKGQIELLMYMHWMDLRILTMPSFSMLVLSTVIITGLATPLLSILYDPSKPYMVNKRRAIQYTTPDTELPIVACIHDQETVAGFINLLEVSNPTSNSPFVVFALRLIELVARAAPVFVDHENQAEAFELTGYNPIHNALTLFEESRGEHVKCHLFTSVSPRRTMYQDVCKLALMKKATLIILPFQKECLDSPTEVLRHGVFQSVNSNVLVHAPCSVGILVGNGGLFRDRRVNYSMRRSGHHIAVLFLGGADAREALAFADRMAGNPDVFLSVIRFLSYNGEGDDLMEKKLDDGLVTWFWVKNEGNERVVYREAVVRNGAETVATIQAMSSEYYDLWIVGRKSGINQVLIQGLSNWSQNHELGAIGDYLASVELGLTASVLVLQQQVLRGQEGASAGLLEKINCC